MQYRSAFPIVYSDDLQRGMGFYRDALGFEETLRFPPEGEPEFVSLVLSDGTGVAVTAARGSSLHGLPLRPGSHAFEMCVYADDVDAAVSDLRGRGFTVLLEPVDQPWDERMAYVADTDGNAVMICAPLNPVVT